MTASPHSAANNPRAYLYQIARNLSVDLYRRERLIDYADPTEEGFPLHRLKRGPTRRRRFMTGSGWR